MLRQRLVLTPGNEDDTKLMPDERRPEHVEELVNEFIPRHLDNLLMKAANQRQMAQEVVGGERLFHLRHDVVELRKLCGRRLFGGKRGGKPLEYLTHLQDACRLFHTESTYLGAAVRLDLHE